MLAIVCAILLAGFAYKKYKGILPEEDTSEQADDSVTEEDKGAEYEPLSVDVNLSKDENLTK